MIRPIFLLSYALCLTSLTFGKCVAHRGDNINFLENSLEAVESAVQLGVYGVEFDVRHTQDGQPFLMHDKDIKRVVKNSKNCKYEEKIKNLTSEELMNCRLKNEQSIPSLERVLRVTSKKPIHIFVEYKDRPNAQDIKLLKRYYVKKEKQLHIISFDKKSLNFFLKLRKSDPFFKEVPLYLLASYNKSVRKYDGIDLRRPRLKSVNYYKKIGKKVGVWTIDDYDKLEKYLESKVDFVTTNDPKTCKEIWEGFKLNV